MRIHVISLLLTVTLLFSLPFAARAQKAAALSPENLEKIRLIEDTLAVLSYTVLNDSLPEGRFAACRSLIPGLVRALKTENSFRYPFGGLPNVSIQYAPDSTFRIFTWQLFVNDNDYRYYGAIQMNTPQLKLFPLVDRSFSMENPEEARLAPDQWYGVVYYTIEQLAQGRDRYYLLFGFDGHEFFRKRKVLDILSFDAAGKPVFGAPLFDRQGPHAGQQRLLLEYSAAATVRLNYDEALQLIVFDNLIEMGGEYGEGPVNYPDGSYSGYRIEKGRLVYVDKVWDQVQDEAPRPMPILDNRSKNLFGKNKR